MPRIRPYRTDDRSAVAQVCVRTADAGGDATGMFRDDRLWADLFVLAYVDRHPEFAFVVEAGDGRAVGYVVCAPNTEDFEVWFASTWWPGVAPRYPVEGAGGREREMIAYARARGQERAAHAAAYPAHLHIDLLPEVQGRGHGRRLIQTLLGALEDAGVLAVHLVASEENAGAVAFYARLGFEGLPSPPGTRAFGHRSPPA